ncbi:MAG: molybdopterin molybdotransferase MoeA [Coriobacteriia bacterium]|nr:molybdopterin molybdotransferase MoeA [Coriobacteriia bacterium]
MDISTVISLEEARAIVAEKVKPGRVETVPLVQAIGRVLAADVTSDIDVAPFDDSAMDGFAVVAADLEAASTEDSVQLECVGYIGAGSCYEPTLQPGQCVRIMTGAPVPAGANAVEKIEAVTFTGEGLVGDTISFTAPIKLGRNIRKAGEEAKAGEVVLPAGTVINPAGAGLLASTGNLEVPVYARPVVGFVGIGSELVDAAEVPGPGMIRDSNRYSVAAYIQAAGGIPRLYARVPDDAEAIQAAMETALAECDALVTTGGACAGDFDLTGITLEKLGEIHFVRVNLKPGKSQPFGTVDGKPVFVLSGNPGASAVGCEMYVRLGIRCMQGYTKLDRPRIKATLTCDIKKKGDTRMILQRGVVSQREDGSWEAVLMGNQSSGLYGSLQRSNCLIVVPTGNADLATGDQVECLLTLVSEEAL